MAQINVDLDEFMDEIVEHIQETVNHKNPKCRINPDTLKELQEIVNNPPGKLLVDQQKDEHFALVREQYSLEEIENLLPVK